MNLLTLKRTAVKKEELEPLPSYISLIENLKARIAAWKTLSFILSVLLALSWMIQSIESHKLMDLAQNKERYFVPVSLPAGETTMRPGEISPHVILSTFNYIWRQLVTVSYDDVHIVYGELEKHMIPELKNRFRREWRAKQDEWREAYYEQKSKSYVPVRHYWQIGGEYIALHKIVVERWYHSIPNTDMTQYLKVVLTPLNMPDPQTGAITKIKSFSWLSEQEYLNEEQKLNKETKGYKQ